MSPATAPQPQQRTIILDGSVFDQINRGNKEVALTLQRLIREGHRVWISRRAHTEMTQDPLIPRTRTAHTLMLAELRIPIAPPGSMGDRIAVYLKNPETGGLSREKDVMIAAQAKAIDAEVWSADGKAFGIHNAKMRAKQFGIRLAPEASLPISQKTADFRVGRNLLGLAPVKISLMGYITPLAPWTPPRHILDPYLLPPGSGKSGGSGGSPGGKSRPATIRAHTGTPTAPVVVGGPSPRAEGVAGGMKLMFQGVGLILNVITDSLNEERMQKAMSEREADITKYSKEHPDEGTLVVLTFRKIQPARDSVVQPKPVFHHLRVYHGVNLTMAKESWQNTPDVSAAAGEGRTFVHELIWMEPIAPRPIKAAELRLPFPRAALASFVVGREIFRDVEFGGLTGFDDCGETIIDDTPPSSSQFLRSLEESILDVVLPFYVLRPPAKLPWFHHGPHEANLQFVSRLSGNGEAVEAINLDPIMLGNATAVMVFPATDYALDLFKAAPPIDDSLNMLQNIANVHLIRFVEPRNLNILKRL